eukprot:172533-Chlamydomonas_euryale.AAC.1
MRRVARLAHAAPRPVQSRLAHANEASRILLTRQGPGGGGGLAAASRRMSPRALRTPARPGIGNV